jgi:hypothetical protein
MNIDTTEKKLFTEKKMQRNNIVKKEPTFIVNMLMDDKIPRKMTIIVETVENDDIKCRFTHFVIVN